MCRMVVLYFGTTYSISHYGLSHYGTLFQQAYYISHVQHTIILLGCHEIYSPIRLVLYSNSLCSPTNHYSTYTAAIQSNHNT